MHIYFMRGRREICGREEQVRQLSQSARMWSGVLGKDIISGRSVKAISKGDCLRSTFNEPGMCVKQNTDKFEQVNILRTNMLLLCFTWQTRNSQSSYAILCFTDA